MTDHIEFLYDTVVKLRPGLKSRRVMVDKEKKLSEFSTADLVAELCSRDELITATSIYSDEEFVWSKWGNLKNGNWGLFDSGRIRNTNARIIVVRGEE